MRNLKIIGFFLVALTVFGLLTFYIVRRGWQALAGHHSGQWIFLGLTIMLFLSFPLGRILARALPQLLSSILGYLSGFFLAALIYAVLFILLIDTFRWANALFHFFPAFITRNPQRAGFVAFWAVLVTIGIILIGGFIGAVYPRVRTLEMTLAKKASSVEGLNIVVASDTHLSSISRDGHLIKIVAKINRLQPDLVLLPGDIVDMDVSLSEEDKMIATLRAIQSPLGVYAVTGNHEYYGGADKNIDYLAKAGVRVLQDEWVKVDEAFYLVGRKDRTADRMGSPRKTLSQILEGSDSRLPLILMDHQPFHLEEAEQNGIDLQVSGHTHAGQLFPITLINKSMYEQYWGYWRRGKTQYYISCGVGTWGMPVRTGSVSEIVLIRIVFQ